MQQRAGTGLANVIDTNGGQVRVTDDLQPLRGKVAFNGDPGSEGGRGPEVLLSLLPCNKPSIIVEQRGYVKVG